MGDTAKGHKQGQRPAPTHQQETHGSFQIFTSGNFRGLITDAIQTELQALKALLSQYADSGKRTSSQVGVRRQTPRLTSHNPHVVAFDLADVFFRFTLDTIGLMAFGANLGALSLDSDAPIPFGQSCRVPREVTLIHVYPLQLQLSTVHRK